MVNTEDWNHIEKLAIQYISEVKKGNGTSIENRSEMQIGLVNEIIENVQPLLYKVADNMLNGVGYCMNKRGTRNFISLNGYLTTTDDLKNEGAIGIIKRLKNYKPDKENISQFLSANAASEMHTATLQSYSYMKVCATNQREIRAICKKSDKVEYVIEGIKKSMGLNDYSAELVLSSVTNSYIDLDEPLGDTEDGASYGDVFLSDTWQFSDPEENMMILDLGGGINLILDTLEESKKQKKKKSSLLKYFHGTILRHRYGIGKEELSYRALAKAIPVEVSHTQIKTEESCAIERLKKRVLEESLDDYL